MLSPSHEEGEELSGPRSMYELDHTPRRERSVSPKCAIFGELLRTPSTRSSQNNPFTHSGE